MANCPAFPLCPVLDGTIASCQANCACRYCGDQNLITQCNGRCTTSSNQIATLNQGTAAVNQGIAQNVQGAISSSLSSLIAPFIAALPLLMERIGLFLFALVLVVAGFMALKS